MRPAQKLTRAEKKAALMQRAEALIEQMLTWTETTTKPNLTQIEDLALDLCQQFGQALSESAITSQENVAPLGLPACPQCGKPMRPKDSKQKTVFARVGDLKLVRHYFYCPACERGLFPLDEQLGVRHGQCSEQVARQVVWLYGHTSGAVTGEALKRLSGIVLSETSVWRCVQQWGEPLQAYAALRQASANALPLRGEVGPTTLRSPQNMGVAMDGAKVHIRTEGWRELKVGCVFDMAVRKDPLAETDEVEDRAHAVHTSYVGIVGGVEGFGRVLWTEALRRKEPQAHDSIVVGDGAPWIWNLAQEHFGSSWQVIDWYHAKQHLHQVANLALGEGSPSAQQWVKTMRTPLYQGQTWQVSAGIQELAAEYPRGRGVFFEPIK